MVNLAVFIEALKLTWIRRLLQSDSKWQDFIKFFIKSGKLVGCSTEYIKKELINIKNPFWIDVFQSWIKYIEKLVVDDEFILKSPIFFNKNILIGGQTIHYDKRLSRFFVESKSTNKFSTICGDKTGH